MTARRDGGTRWAPSLGLALALACGGRTGLEVPDAAAGGRRDAAPSMDAGLDAGRVEPDECIELPLAEPRELEVSFLVQILRADVFFLVDVTGSMSEEIAQIRAQVREAIIPQLADSIPDVRFGVGHFADFPLPERNYGEATDELYRVLQASTRDRAAVQRAVDRLPLQGGRDGPEAMVEALYLTATGEGMGPFVEPATCPERAVGHPCFPLGSTPIVLVFSDAPSHNGPNGRDTYVGVLPPPHTYEEAVGALNRIGAKVLGLYSGGPGGFGLSDLQSFARETGAMREDGTPIVFDIGIDGRFLGRSVVDAVRALVEDTPIDVDVLLEDIPGDGFDATALVERVVAVGSEPMDGATNEGDRFTNVRPGTRVRFRVVLVNELIPPTEVPQSFLLRVVLRGDGVVRLQESVVRVVVPALGGAGCAPP